MTKRNFGNHMDTCPNRELVAAASVAQEAHWNRDGPFRASSYQVL
jgi:hypothetical protein